MSKVCIVCAGAVRNMVMVYMYTDFLQANGIDYDMIYMDKYHEEEITGAKKNYRIEYDGTSKKGKIDGYLSFIRKSTVILKKKNYQFVIVWGELTAALLNLVLTKNFKKRYCINVRDLFVGKRKILNILLNSSIKKANYVTVSSPKYLEELPSKYNNYLFVHSFNNHIMDETNNIKKENSDEKIRILYIGNIRFLNHLYRLIDEIKNDKRFELTVAGYGSDEINSFVNDNHINNIKVYGAFPKENTSQFLSNADVIYNLYGTEDINLRYALSNKLYYAVCLEVPILVYKDTYMYDISSGCDIGFAFDNCNKNEFADSFYEWYQMINKESVHKKCTRLIQEACESQNKMLHCLSDILKEMKIY